jgi:hypothetical protein
VIPISRSGNLSAKVGIYQPKFYQPKFISQSLSAKIYQPNEIFISKNLSAKFYQQNYIHPELDPTKQTGDRWLKHVLHRIWTSIWRVWLIRNDDLHGRDKDKQERKRIAKLRPHVLALYSKQDLLLACDKPIFELPIRERMKLHSRELSTWIALVTPTVKRAAADADQYLRDTNHSIIDFLAAARPDPLTTDELVNELRPVSCMRP